MVKTRHPSETFSLIITKFCFKRGGHGRSERCRFVNLRASNDIPYLPLCSVPTCARCQQARRSETETPYPLHPLRDRSAKCRQAVSGTLQANRKVRHIRCPPDGDNRSYFIRHFPRLGIAQASLSLHNFPVPDRAGLGRETKPDFVKFAQVGGIL